MELVINTNDRSLSKEEHLRLKKRSKRKKFMSNAKNFGKKGIYGRGSQIEETEFTYFINILDAMKKGWESLDDKTTMANNVFEQTTDKEIHLSSNQVVCKAIESLIGFVDSVHLERYMCKFRENLRPLCSDKFASHILQKMVEIALLRSIENPQKDHDDDEPVKKKTKPNNVPTEKEYNTTTNFSEDHRQACSQFVISVGKFLLNNLEDFLWDPYANHVMRTAVNSLAGVHVTKVAFKHISGKINKDKPLNVPDEWLDIVKDYVIRLQMWPQFPELPYNEFSSGLLGTLCIVMRDVDKNLLKTFGKKILSEAFLKIDDADEKKIEIDDEEQDENKSEENKLPKVFSDPSSIRLLETLLACSGPKLFSQFYALLFAGRELILAKNRATNFSVHKLIDNMKEKVDFETVFEKLADSLEELLKLGHTGVVSSLSGACLRLATKQAAFVVSLQNALHTTGSKEKTDAFVKCLLKLKPYDVISAAADNSQFIHVHGSVILQNMLKFNKPIKLVQNLMDIPPHELTAIFTSANGSFIVDAFLESKFIGEKSRDKLVRHMDGNYLDLAITKFGSRVVEKLFEAAVDAQKLKIIKELSDKVNQLNGTMFGRLLFHKFRVETYKLSPTQWKAAYDRANKAEKLLKDIVDK